MTITFLQVDADTTTLLPKYTGQQFRQGQAATHGGGSGRRLGGRSGFRVDTPSNVLTATSTTWTLGACAAMIDPGTTTHQGMYGWATDANETGTVTAADATNPRKDIVYIQVNDKNVDTSGALSAPVLYLAGTPAATPAAPTLPPRSFLVGTISVPVAGGGSPTVVRNPAVFVAAGAALPVFSPAERDALTAYDGLTVRRMDLPNRPAFTWDGTKWAGPPLGTLSNVVNAGSNVVGITLNNMLETTVSVEANRSIEIRATIDGSSSMDAMFVGYTLAYGGTGTGGTSVRTASMRYTTTGLGEAFEVTAIVTTSAAGSLRFNLQAQVTVPSTGGQTMTSTAGNTRLTVKDLGNA